MNSGSDEISKQPRLEPTPSPSSGKCPDCCSPKRDLMESSLKAKPLATVNVGSNPTSPTIDEIAEKWARITQNSLGDGCSLAQEFSAIKQGHHAAILESTEKLRENLQRWQTGCTANANEAEMLRAELDLYKQAAGFCEQHKPDGGARNCLVCGCIELSAAISRISYLLGKPNEMGFSDYDLHYDSQTVVKQLEQQLSTKDDSKELLDWLEKTHTLHQTVEFLYVVYGYRLSVLHDGNELASFTESTVAKAIRSAMNAEKQQIK